MLIQLAAHRSNGFLQIIGQLEVILQFWGQGRIEITEQGSADTFGVAADRFGAFIFVFPADVV